MATRTFRHPLVPLFGLALVLGTAQACAPAQEGGDDAGSEEVRGDGGTGENGSNGGNGGNGGSTDGGTNGGGNGGTNGGTNGGGNDGGGGGGGDKVLGDTCTPDSDPCTDAAHACVAIYGNSDAACFLTCDPMAGTGCNAAGGLAGACLTFDLGGGENTSVCVVESDQLGPCGNGNNATCSVGQCLQAQGVNKGFCARVCDPEDPTTCLGADTTAGLPAEDCGCEASQGCSVQPVGVNLAGVDGTLGICAPPSNAGDPCSADPPQLCTGTQVCGAEMGSASGTCQEPTSADGGMGGGGSADGG
jgi:hypothetical protein